MLLGATGVGLISIYQSIVDMIRSVANMGIETSGVRDISSANRLDNKKLVSETVAVFKWWTQGTATLSVLICIVFCYPISIWAFGREDAGNHVLSILSLSLCLFFTMLGMGQFSILQGLRRIPEMVKANIIGNAAGLLAAIPLYWQFGLKGIIPSIIVGSIILYIVSSYYSKRVDISKVDIPTRIAFNRGVGMLKLGMFVVSAGICNTASMFVMRSVISLNMDIEAVGLFQSAWTITNVYLALILRSMGSDFYPRLCAVSSSNIRIRKLVNEQTHVILIIASPIIVGMLWASEFILPILYTSGFSEAAGLLRWQVLGTFFKVLSWPLGFILLAKGKGMMFFLSEVFFFALYLVMSYLLFDRYGLNGTGIAYFIAYIFYLLLLFFMAVRICNFKWRRRVFILGGISFLLISLSFYIQHYEHNMVLGAFLLVGISIWSIFRFNKILRIASIAKYFKRKK